MAEQLGMRGADVMRAGVPELGFAAVAIEHADRGHAVAARAALVRAAGADHDGRSRIHLRSVERVAQQIALVGPRAVELGAEHALEIAPPAEMIDEPLGGAARLA